MDKAILVVSYGTAQKETADKTIGAIEKELAEAFPGRKFYRAWTSRMIIKIMKERQGVEIETPDEAFERMKKDGVKDVLVQATHLMQGMESEMLTRSVDAHKAEFDSVKTGAPLLDTEEDLSMVADALIKEFPDVVSGEASLVLMGHGSKAAKQDGAAGADPNSVYVKMQEAFRKKGFDNVFVGTVEAEPTLSDVMEGLAGRAGEASGKVYLTPFMVVAGTHATKDMTGDSDDTWEKKLASAGYEVIPVVRGLGEYPAIRAIYRKHINVADRF